MNPLQPPTANSENVPSAAPVSQSERIVIIDSLRGIALLGILLMNIPYFGLPDPVADNLMIRHELGNVNGHVWYFINWLLEGSQRALFSMLFGTGVILFITRLEKRTSGMIAAEYFIRRQLWLLVFGLFDAFILLWPGDILFEYAIGGIIVFVFRKLEPRKLFIAAFVCLILMTARENRDLYTQKSIIAKGELIARMDTTKVKLNDLQKEELGAMKDIKERNDSASVRKEAEKNQRQILGSYSELYRNYSNMSARLEFNYGYYGIWDVIIFMFIGMAFFKTGILTGEAPVKTYWMLFLGSMIPGLILSYYRLQPVMNYHFNWFVYAKNKQVDYYEISRVFRSLGIFGFIMLLYKSGWFSWLFKLVRPVGQMAFTNYLMQSFLCGLYFYGVGFGMYGQLQRYQIYFVVGAVWIVEIIWSHIWLRYFRFGPMEWVWRSLTYWKRQPMKRNA